MNFCFQPKQLCGAKSLAETVTFNQSFSNGAFCVMKIIFIYLNFSGLNLLRTTFSECVKPSCWFSPSLLSKVLLQLDLGELSEISHVFHPQSLCNGCSQLPSQITTEDQEHIMHVITVMGHKGNHIISWYRWIYLHFTDGKGAKELWNRSQRQNCLAIGFVQTTCQFG